MLPLAFSGAHKRAPREKSALRPSDVKSKDYLPRKVEVERKRRVGNSRYTAETSARWHRSPPRCAVGGFLFWDEGPTRKKNTEKREKKYLSFGGISTTTERKESLPKTSGRGRCSVRKRIAEKSKGGFPLTVPQRAAVRRRY